MGTDRERQMDVFQTLTGKAVLQHRGPNKKELWSVETITCVKVSLRYKRQSRLNSEVRPSKLGGLLCEVS